MICHPARLRTAQRPPPFSKSSTRAWGSSHSWSGLCRPHLQFQSLSCSSLIFDLHFHLWVSFHHVRLTSGIFVFTLIFIFGPIYCTRSWSAEPLGFILSAAAVSSSYMYVCIDICSLFDLRAYVLREGPILFFFTYQRFLINNHFTFKVYIFLSLSLATFYLLKSH